ncbi:single-stranded DNA-binding protein [Xanthomonas vesicatoria]|uniref:single-stranded DNA-binding protein n=1 Tax=Xanthomonas vesicatoria TaxID=56460 RepID=UPI0024126E06|nr:single-stranded DNA-binding protein [Xanthomonas vesicatoria]MDG4488807.1 single-stranded DNA-binding protein [Xanthomonas vesicatoria]
MSGIKVTVLSAQVEEREGTFADDAGKERKYTTRKQKCRIEAGGFAYPYDARLEDGEKAYLPGDYDLDVDAMLEVNKGNIQLRKFAKLKPRQSSPARAAA